MDGWTLAVLGIAWLIGLGSTLYVAKERGRSGIEGWAFGIILGPIGIIAVGMLPIRPPAALAASKPVSPLETRLRSSSE
jgi:peptidoglycan/LPS O-acetylase OafA/YrhL